MCSKLLLLYFAVSCKFSKGSFHFSFHFFSTSDRIYQMCYCCRKLDFEEISDSQMCEADLRGRFVRPWGLDWLSYLCQRVLDLWEPIRGARPHTASQIGLSDRPHTSGSPKFPQNRPLILSASQNFSCDLSEPIRGARPLTHTASQICEAVGVRSPIGLSRTPGDAVILGPVWLISRLNALPHTVESDRPLTHSGRCSPIGLSNLWGRAHHKVMWSVWESEVRGRTRPHRFESPIGLSRTAGDAVWSSAKCIASAGRGVTGPVCVRGRSDSQICEAVYGLSLRTLRQITQPHRSDSLTDRTLWQIWLSDRSDRLDWS